MKQRLDAETGLWQAKWTQSGLNSKQVKKAESTYYTADFSRISNSHDDMEHAQTPCHLRHHSLEPLLSYSL